MASLSLATTFPRFQSSRTLIARKPSNSRVSLGITPIPIQAVMGLSYFAFLAMNKDEGPKGGDSITTSPEDSLEEARRIMEKYK